MPKFTKNSENNAGILKGDVESPSRQVLLSFLVNAVHVDKQTALKSYFETKPCHESIPTARTQKRKGRRARNKLKQQPPCAQKWWGSVWTVGEETAVYDEPGELQPEVEVGGDHSLFTRTTDPRNPRRVAEILKHVKIGPDLSEDERKQVQTLIAEYADCFALSVWEVLPIPGAEHRIHVPPNITFPKKVPHQRQLTEAQRAYLSDAIDELQAADIIEPIRPEDVKCTSPITLAQKVHNTPGLSLNELQHRVNEECIANGHPPTHKVEPRTNESLTPASAPVMMYDPTQPQKWRVCQNYGALNRVTHVFPLPQGDIRTKQRRLSGRRWIHGFDFASGFYTVTIPKESRPYLAYYVEGRGFWTNKRMPFGLTGAPATFAHVTANKLGDLLPKLEIELLVDDGGMAGDEFDNMMNRTRQFFTRVRKSSLSLSAKKSEFFMTSIIFAGARVGPGGVQPDNTKLTAVVDWREPPDLLNLSRFLGLTGYFRDLVKGYAKLA